MSTWMVVEDEPDIYDVLLAMFEIWGIEGVAFVDGAEAVAWIEDVDHGRVRGDLPELAILDIRLPEISGPEVGKRLRESPILGDIAIVLITAYRLSPTDEQAVIKEAQADLLMYKPLPAMPELRRMMDDVIAKHKKKRAEPVASPANEKAAAAAPGPGSALKNSEDEPAASESADKPAEAKPESKKDES